jgi:hypothetical protein
MDFGQLAEETLELESQFRGRNPFDCSRDESQVALEIFSQASEELPPEVHEILYPDSPGLVYWIDAAGSTFGLRGLHTGNISSTFQSLKQKEPDLLKKLRVSSDSDDGPEFYFFETQSIEEAEVLADQYLRRRFPFSEEMVCNLSDPGFSWWMQDELQNFTLSFKTVGRNGKGESIQLGPIGDRKIASLMLTELENYFPLSQLNCPEKSFSLSGARSEGPYFDELRKLFLEGQTPHECLKKLSVKNKTLGFYLNELAVLRSFWIDLSDKLEEFYSAGKDFS